MILTNDIHKGTVLNLDGQRWCQCDPRDQYEVSQALPVTVLAKG